MVERSVRILVHIVTWNSAKTIVPCCVSVLQQQFPNDRYQLTLRISDNASADNTVELLKANFGSPVDIQRNTANLGFCEGHNHACSAALDEGFDYVLVLNPDTRLTPTAVMSLVHSLENDPRAGTATPKLLRADEALRPLAPPVFDAAGMYMTPSTRHLDRGSNEHDVGQYDRMEYVFGGTGACLLIRTSFIRDVALPNDTGRYELFDERFFAYREDADLAWRGRQLGWECLYVPQSLVYHERRVLPERRAELPEALNRLGVRNRFLMLANNFSWSVRPKTLLQTTLRNLVVFAAACSVERSSLPAFQELWNMRSKIRARRSRLARRRRVGGATLDRWFSTVPFSEPCLLEGSSGSAPRPDSPSETLAVPLPIRSVLVVVVNYNSRFRFAESLEQTLHVAEEVAPHFTMHIAAVDNASTDGSPTAISERVKRSSQVSLLLNSENRGFAGAINQAAAAFPGDAILVLNPDVTLNAAGVLTLVQSLERYTSLGAVTPRLVGLTGQAQEGFTARRFPSLLSTLQELFLIHRLWPNNPWRQSALMLDEEPFRHYLIGSSGQRLGPFQPTHVPYVVEQPAGACLLIRRAAFRHLHGFDEQFSPAWFEDVDFCKRLAEAGYAAAVIGSSTAIHEGGYSLESLSITEFSAIWYANMKRYWRKHGSWFERVTISISIPVGLTLRALMYAVDGLLPRPQRKPFAKEHLQRAWDIFKLAVRSPRW